MDDRSLPAPAPPPRDRPWLFFDVWMGRTKPYSYFAAGTVLFLLKYAVDWSVSRLLFGHSWKPVNYLVPSAYYSIWSIPPGERWFYWTLIVLAVPFMVVGLALTVRRLRDAALPLGLSVLFFVPFANLPFFLALCLVPSRVKPAADAAMGDREETVREGESGESVTPLESAAHPESKFPSAIAAVLISGLCSLALVGGGTHFLRHYGWGLFVGIPFCLGMVSSLVHGYFTPRSLKSCFGVSLTALGLVAGGLLVFALEGIICMVMASPIALLLTFVGTLVGWAIQDYPRSIGDDSPPDAHTRIFPAILIGLPAIMSGEALFSPAPSLRPVRTSVVAKAPPERVWRNVISFSELPPPDPGDWIFRTGIAYPVRAEISGCGPGAVRHCVFSTGAFVEPITVWDEPRLLRFSVTEQPPAMEELSLYSDLHPPHLDGYLESEQGQFLLTRLPDGTTLLEGTTWYRNRMWPEAYWGLWSDWIIHRIHERVLQHVRQLSEGNEGPLLQDPARQSHAPNE